MPWRAGTGVRAPVLRVEVPVARRGELVELVLRAGSPHAMRREPARRAWVANLCYDSGQQGEDVPMDQRPGEGASMTEVSARGRANART